MARNLTFTGWLQDGADALNMLLDKINSGQIDPDDLDDNLRSGLEATCECASSEVDGILLDLRERLESEVTGDPYAEFRHAKHELV